MSNTKFIALLVAAVAMVFVVRVPSFAGQSEAPTSSVSIAAATGGDSDVSMAFSVDGAPMQSCAYSYDLLPTSNTYAASDWESSFRMDWNSLNGVSLPREQMIDLNGDGLVDYQYVSISNASSSGNDYYTYVSCVYLNTGSGFEPAHRCYAQLQAQNRVLTSQTYQGDCAG